MININTDNKYFNILKEYIFKPLYKLLIYVLKNPFKTAWFLLKLYIMLIVLVLMLVFSFAANAANFDDYTIDELKQPSIELKQKWLGNVGSENVSSIGIEGTAKITWAKSAIATANSIASVDIKNSAGYSLNGSCKNAVTLTDSSARLEGRIDCEYHHDTTGSKGFLQYRYVANMVGIEEMPKCPPTNNTTHTIGVYDSFNKLWCAPPKKDTCPKKSDDMMAFTFGSPDQTRICFQNPTEPTKKCEYNGADGVFAHPSSMKEPIACEDGGEPINNTLPPTNPDDGCFESPTGNKYCEANPNDKCNTLTVGKNADGSPITAMKCGTNCGEAFGVFLCTEDSNNDQMPEITDSCLDEHFRLANPTVCSSDNTSLDKDGDGQVDAKDTVTGLNNLNKSNEDLVKGVGAMVEINKAMLDKISDDKANGVDTNKILSNISSGISAIDSNVAKIADSLGVGSGEAPAGLELTVPNELTDNKHDWQTENFYTVTQTFLQGVKSSTVYSSVDNFFKVSFSGSCPVYTTTIDVFGTITFDQWCGETMGQVWPWVEAILLLVFSFLAFREVNSR